MQRPRIIYVCRFSNGALMTDRWFPSRDRARDWLADNGHADETAIYPLTRVDD